jgi:hypothetical protein
LVKLALIHGLVQRTKSSTKPPATAGGERAWAASLRRREPLDGAARGEVGGGAINRPWQGRDSPRQAGMQTMPLHILVEEVDA